jgi:hypothetical protein
MADHRPRRSQQLRRANRRALARVLSRGADRKTTLRQFHWLGGRLTEGERHTAGLSTVSTASFDFKQRTISGTWMVGGRRSGKAAESKSAHWHVAVDSGAQAMSEAGQALVEQAPPASRAADAFSELGEAASK